jgi:uncharacterized SAM-binding protein YcdF (DUF218 family)
VCAAIGAGALLLYTTYRISSQGDRDEQRPADAIVVLGAAQFDGRPSGVFIARLDHAVELYQQGIAPYFVVTGGKIPGDRTTEAGVARAYALAHGVPANRILMEDTGRNTLQSLESVGRILRDRGLRSAVFVSDRTHMLRVLRIASDQGIVAWGSPTTTSQTDNDPSRRGKAMLHELAGIVAYYFGGGGLIDDSAVSGAQ